MSLLVCNCTWPGRHNALCVQGLGHSLSAYASHIMMDLPQDSEQNGKLVAAPCTSPAEYFTRQDSASTRGSTLPHPAPSKRACDEQVLHLYESPSCPNTLIIVYNCLKYPLKVVKLGNALSDKKILHLSMCAMCPCRTPMSVITCALSFKRIKIPTPPMGNTCALLKAQNSSTHALCSHHHDLCQQVEVPMCGMQHMPRYGAQYTPCCACQGLLGRGYRPRECGGAELSHFPMPATAEAHYRACSAPARRGESDSSTSMPCDYFDGVASLPCLEDLVASRTCTFLILHHCNLAQARLEPPWADNCAMRIERWGLLVTALNRLAVRSAALEGLLEVIPTRSCQCRNQSK